MVVWIFTITVLIPFILDIFPTPSYRMSMKDCPDCGPRPVAAFGRNSNNPDGLTTYCRACQNARQRAWKAANPDKVRRWRRRYIRRIKAQNVKAI